MQVARGLKLYFIHFSEGHAFSTSGICPKLFAGHVQVNLIDYDPGMLLPEWSFQCASFVGLISSTSVLVMETVRSREIIVKSKEYKETESKVLYCQPNEMSQRG